MPQFVAINADVEVNTNSILSVVNSMPKGRDARLNILKKYNIDLVNNDWHPQQDWLNAFQEIANTLGEMNLFMIGKAIIDHAEFPPVKTLEEALRSLDIAYHMNHRLNGQVMFNPATGSMQEGIGHYRLLSFDDERQEAVLQCNNPYPSKFDEGIITQLVRRFKPSGSREVVLLDTTNGCRNTGGEACNFVVKW